MQELLGEKKDGGDGSGGTTGTASDSQQGGEDPVSTTGNGTEEGSQEAGEDNGANEAVTVEDPMNKLRFKKNILLNNLVTHFKEQQLQASPTNNTANPSQSNGTPALHPPPLPTSSLGDNDLELDLDLSLGLGMDGTATELLELATASHDQGHAGLMGMIEEGELPDATMSNAASPIPRKPHTPDPTLEGLPPPPGGSGDGSSRHIWVGNLGPGVKEQHLRDAFQGFGPLQSVRLLRRSTMNMVGFVHFNESEDAMKAKAALDGTYLSSPGASGPHPIRIQYQATGNNPPCATLRVHNISPQGRYSIAYLALQHVYSLLSSVCKVQ